MIGNIQVESADEVFALMPSLKVKVNLLVIASICLQVGLLL